MVKEISNKVQLNDSNTKEVKCGCGSVEFTQQHVVHVRFASALLTQTLHGELVVKPTKIAWICFKCGKEMDKTQLGK